MLASVFPSPYVDILKHFAKDWSQAELSGDVRQVIDKSIGKQVFAIGGTTAASNFLALPKSGPAGLGLSGKHLYVQLCLVKGQPFTIHFDLVTDAKFVVRVSFSNRYTALKRVGTVVQLPCPESLTRNAGQWTVLAVHLPKLTSSVVEPGKGQFATLKSIVACSALSIRAAFTSDTAFTPATIPRVFALPLTSERAFDELYGWQWLPPGPPPMLGKAVGEPELALKVTPPAGALSKASPKTSPEVEAARRRRQRSGAAPRALFPPPPQRTEPAEPSLLKLSRVLGYSGEKPGLLVWLKDGRRMLYAAASVLILQDIDSGAQQFLIGHTADVCALSAAETTPLVASAQEGELAVIRLWDRDACVPLAILRQHASHMHAVALSADGALLAGVGKDGRGRQMLAVWDVTEANAPIPSCPLVDAKVSSTHIKAIAWVPPDPMDVAARVTQGAPLTDGAQLVSCGFENVRFWRLKRSKLHVCGMALQHEEGNLFLSIAIDQPSHGGGGAERKGQRRMLVGGSSGRLFVIDPSTRTLEYVHALHDDAIQAVHLSAGFAVTGGADRKLRVWPLDFSSHFLEAEHEGGVTTVHASPDGLKLIIGTASGTIGLLDVPTLKHATLVRSHTDIVYGLAVDPHNREFVTASCDGSIRVWELDGNQAQLVEFELPAGCSRCVAYHPTEYAVACGFDDGSMRVFDIASTSLLEEFTQHKGKVVDLVYSHAADKLFSAGTDCTICTYDVLHGYQPSRSFSATPFADASPCLAVANDDTVLVAGNLERQAVLLFDASTLVVLATVPTAVNVTGVAFGPARTVFMTNSEGSLISLPLSSSAARAAGAPAEVGLMPGAHTTAADAIVLARNGLHVVSGGQDRMIKLWPTAAVRTGGAPPMGTGPGSCQRYVGHSDHVTKLAFSSDGQTLVSVGGGDAIFVWEYTGPAGVDPNEVVEESVRQAEVERAERLAERGAADRRIDETLPTPSQVLQQSTSAPAVKPTDGSSQPAPAVERPVLRAAELIAGAQFENLRERLRKLGTSEAGYMMAGAEAAMNAAAPLLKGKVERRQQQQEEPELPAEEPVAEEEEEYDVEGEDESEVPQGPRKRFIARVVYGDDEEDEDETDSLFNEMADGDRDATAAGLAKAAEDALTGGYLAPSCATALKLQRLIGFSAHAHDHIIWHTASATLIYATGDTLVIDSVNPTTQALYLTGGSGEISTLALSPDGRFAAVGSGGDSPTCVYDLMPRTRDAGSSGPQAVLRMRLPGHVGGVQSLAFLGNAALASVGLEDSSLKVYSILSGAQLLTTVTPPDMHALAVSTDGMELSAAGKGGIHTWRVSTQPSEDGSARATLLPLPTRQHPSEEAMSTYGVSEDDVQITALVHLSSTLSLAGDSAGMLTLWGPPTDEGASPIGNFDLSSMFGEVDLLQATPVVIPATPADLASWHVIVGGVSATHTVRRFRLTLPPSSAAAKAEGAELILTPIGELDLDGDGIAFSWDASGEQGVVGTDAGSLWHIEWASLAKTLLVGAVPPPLGSIAVGPAASQRVMASLSTGEVQGEKCGVLLWDCPPPELATSEPPCAAPLARIYQPNEETTCIAISPPTAEHESYADPDGSEGLCAVGYASGRLQLISVSALKLLKERRVHVAPLSCVQFGPSRTLLTAASDGEVRLHSAAMAELLVPLATLRAPTNVPVTAIDVLVGKHGATDETQAPRWLVASEHQQVQVWPLIARTDANVRPLVTFNLETAPLLTVPTKLQPLGWKCLAVFCPLRSNVIAASGVTRERRITLFDYVQKAALAYLPLDEWPTALSACPSAPLLAVGGASGSVKLVEYLAKAQTAAEQAEEEEVMLQAAAVAMTSEGSGGVVGGLIRSAASVELHCHNVRSLHFSETCLYSAADDEMSQWQLPL